ncbi:UNVERIFIED_CONTAM: Rho GTPase-activating protein 22 [Gekko kuhli]
MSNLSAFFSVERQSSKGEIAKFNDKGNKWFDQECRELKKIEETSAELRKLVAKLEDDLDREKKKYRLLEIKLRNSERACEDAGKRNQLLQREMEDFFATLGDLTAENLLGRAPK